MMRPAATTSATRGRGGSGKSRTQSSPPKAMAAARNGLPRAHPNGGARPDRQAWETISPKGKAGGNNDARAGRAARRLGMIAKDNPRFKSAAAKFSQKKPPH